MKKIFLVILLALPILNFAQTQSRKAAKKEQAAKDAERIRKLKADAETGTIIFNKQSAVNFALHNDGYSIGFEKGKFTSIHNSNLWWINLGERKSTKEEKTQSTSGTNIGNPYIYGKINNFYYLKVGFGKQLLLAGKNSANGVAVQAIYGGGVSLGMLKPYYLEAYKVNNTNETEMIKYADSADRFLEPTNIVGSAPFGKGFGEIKFVPGFFAKAALRFEYGKLNDIIGAIELGLNAEFYTQKMPIMALAKEKNFFISSYISFIFGSRK